MMNFNKVEYRKIPFITLLLFCVLGVFSCVPPSDEITVNSAEQDFSNPVAQTVYRLQQEQNVDSLLYYIESEDPMARFCATRAFGSLQDKACIPSIRKMLKDTISAIKAEAAYTAGQLRDTSLVGEVVAAFEADIANEVNDEVNKNVLEAIGKIGSEVHLSFLSSSKPYPVEFTLLNEGKAHAYYQFALRGLVNDDATAEMVKFATEEYSDETRVIAANYLLRTQGLDLKENKFQLLQALYKEENPHVRMGLSAAVAKTGSSEIIEPFLDHLDKEKDYRVVVNGIRNLGEFNYIEIVDAVLQFLSHENEHVAKAAIGYLKANGQSADARFYLDYVSKIKSPTAKIQLQGAVLSVFDQYYARSRGRIVTDLEKQFNEQEDPYIKAEIVSALGSNPYNYIILDKLGLQDSSVIVQSKASEAFGNVLTGYLKDKPRSTQRYLAPIIFKYLAKAINSGDAGAISAAAFSLSQYDPQYLQRIMPDTLFTNAFNKMNYPVDLEPMKYLADAHNLYFPETKISLPDTDSRRAYINDKFSEFSSTYTAVIETDAGEIQVELFLTHSPETALNFIDLAEQNYYDGKVFHRVVSNFVVQAGCPRGDGYGSEEFTIRSELSPMRYLDEGYIGMASAGNHTESTQWFITHSPTPHLSGRYTIFGKVKAGMDLVHSMGIGTRINNVSIVDIPKLQ